MDKPDKAAKWAEKLKRLEAKRAEIEAKIQALLKVIEGK